MTGYSIGRLSRLIMAVMALGCTVSVVNGTMLTLGGVA